MKPAITYDELIEGYFGVEHRHRHRHGRHHHHRHPQRFGRRLAQTAEQVVAGYYGHEAVLPRLQHPAGFKVSLAVDDGETLEPSARSAALDEYVIEASLADGNAEEYVIEASTPGAAAMQAADPGAAPGAGEEYLVNVCDPLSGGSTASGAPAPFASSPAAAVPTPDKTARTSSLDEEFMNDMRAILSRGASDESCAGRTAPPEPARAAPAAATGQPQPDATPSSHAIFDRIAQSMQYANTYDLGTVELENRFADFDRFADLEDHKERRGPAPGVRTAKASDTETAMAVGAEDFLSDLDEMQRGRGRNTQRRSDEDGDPFAFVPPSQPGSAQPAPAACPDGRAGDGPAAAAAPGQIPQIQIPSIPGITAPASPAPDSASAPDSQ